MSKYDIRPQNTIFGSISNVKIEFRMSKSRSKCDVRPKFECQNRILSVKIMIFGPTSNVRIGF